MAWECRKELNFDSDDDMGDTGIDDAGWGDLQDEQIKDYLAICKEKADMAKLAALLDGLVGQAVTNETQAWRHECDNKNC